MSFALTTEQVRNRTKTVTRRLGWRSAKAGDVVQPVVKGQGLKKGERVERIGRPIRLTHVCVVRLNAMLNSPHWGKRECVAEGFPDMTPAQFVRMFCLHNNCEETAEVTRIEFEYLNA